MRNEKSGYERYVEDYFQRQRDMEDEEKQTNQPAAKDVSRLAKKLIKWFHLLTGKRLGEDKARLVARTILSGHNMTEQEIVEAIRSKKSK